MEGTDVKTSDVVVVGGGVVGLFTAWRVAQAGLRVSVVDPTFAGGAACAAGAGIGGPQPFEEAGLNRWAQQAARRFGDSVQELRELVTAPVDYLQCGSLTVALTGAPHPADLEGLAAENALIGANYKLLDREECLALEPELTDTVIGGLFRPDDAMVDPPSLMAALREAIATSGYGELITSGVTDLLISAGRAQGVRLTSGEEIHSDAVVLATGAPASWPQGLPDWIPNAITPVAGLTLRLKWPRPAPLNTILLGNGVGVLPRAGLEVVTGGSKRPGIRDVLLEDLETSLNRIRQLVPALAAAPVLRLQTGVRPQANRGYPLIGPTEITGLHLALGHYRQGVLLSATTADLVLHGIEKGALPEEARWLSADGSPSPAPG